MKYAFSLGREYKLSLAELIHIFGEKNLKNFDENIAIFEMEKISEKILQNLGGSMRMMEIISETSPETFATDTIEYIKTNVPK